MAWLTGWQYRKKITIDQTKVDANLSDFPVLVKLTSSNFDFSKALSTGYDVRFTSSDGETLLKYERERHDQANSLAEYWVKVPSVSGTVDTDFYIYYGKSDASDGSDAANVWDSNHKLVVHSKDLTTSTVKDSVTGSSFSKQSANHPIEADGKIGKAQNYDGSQDYIDCEAGSGLDITGTAITLEALVNITSYVDGGMFFCKGNSVGEPPYKQYTLEERVVNSIGYMRFMGDFDGTCANNDDTTEIGTGSWKYLVVSYDGANVRFYIDGSPTTSPARTGNLMTHSTWKLLTGKLTYTTNYFDGKMDEMRISNSVRSAAWIKATYNSNFDTLVSYGGEQQPPIHGQVSFFELM